MAINYLPINFAIFWVILGIYTTTITTTNALANAGICSLDFKNLGETLGQLVQLSSARAPSDYKKNPKNKYKDGKLISFYNIENV